MRIPMYNCKFNLYEDKKDEAYEMDKIKIPF